MEKKKSPGPVANLLARLDFRPLCGQLHEDLSCVVLTGSCNDAFGRSRAKAEKHSIGVAHHATTALSCSAIFRRTGVRGSSRQSGMIAEASQNFIALAPAPP